MVMVMIMINEWWILIMKIANKIIMNNINDNEMKWNDNVLVIMMILLMSNTIN